VVKIQEEGAPGYRGDRRRQYKELAVADLRMRSTAGDEIGTWEIWKREGAVEWRGGSCRRVGGRFVGWAGAGGSLAASAWDSGSAREDRAGLTIGKKGMNRLDLITF
jgi:hypothetical protein